MYITGFEYSGLERIGSSPPLPLKVTHEPNLLLRIYSLFVYKNLISTLINFKYRGGNGVIPLTGIPYRRGLAVS